MLTQNLCNQARKRASDVGLILFAFLLTACGTQPAPPAAPTSPPTETPTPQSTLTPTPTVIPGPFEGQPTIPYPSDEVIQELGITAYQVVGEQYVALSEEGYVVAQAITDEKGEFTGWQRTLPFDVETGLVVPHPQETNPELFELKKSDAPIPQFVNAMKMGGIEVEPQEVANNLQYQAITGADGKQYVIGTFNLDPDPNQQGETLEGPIPLMVWGEEKGWRSIVNSLRELADARNFRFGSQIVYYELNDPTYVDLAKGNFNFLVSAGELGEPDLWRISDINQNFDYDYSRVDKILRLARDMKAPILLLHIADPTEWPDWARQLPQNEFEEIGKKQIIHVMNHIRNRYPDGTIVYSVVNEVFDWNRFRYPESYIEMAFTTARQTDPQAILIYNDVNVFHEGRIDHHDRAVMRLVNKLKTNNLVDGVGLQMHLRATQLPSSTVFAQLIDIYKQMGVRVYITEFDIDFEGFAGTEVEKQQLKARIYQQMLRVAMEKEVEAFLMFGFTGAAAWHPDGLIFDRSYRPEGAFYAIASEFLQFTANQK